MRDNPYAAPKASLVANEPASVSLFTTPQAVVATLLSGFLATVLMIHRNLIVLERPVMARGALGLGLALLVLLVVWTLLAPGHLSWLIEMVLPATVGGFLIHDITRANRGTTATGIYRNRPIGHAVLVTVVSFVAEAGLAFLMFRILVHLGIVES